MSEQQEAPKFPESTVRPIPTRENWALLLETYKKVKGGTDHNNDKWLLRYYDACPTGLKIPYEARQTEKKGRGIFCTKDIPEGTEICGEAGGRFLTEDQWRTFLGILPPELAKDCVDWAVVEECDDVPGKVCCCLSSKVTREVLFLDFCDLALMNHGSMKDGKANCKGRTDSDGDWCMVAARDIATGEELLTDYTLSGSGYDHNLSWYTEVYQEYYPGVAIDASELKRFSEE